MTDIRDVERADRLGRRRARIFAVQAVLFLTWQGTFFLGYTAEPLRTVDQVRVSAWFVWVVALLLMLGTGGFLLRGRGVRALLNDELTRANRAMACVAGFWAAMAAGILLYVVDMFDPVTTREALHLILSAAIATALIVFALRERRSAGTG